MLTETGSRREIVDFYTKPNESGVSLLEIWENGDAMGDSVTPSTSSSEYRAWITDVILGERRGTARTQLLSLGCGNAMVEARLAASGVEVLATDLCEPAVALARTKGLEARVADIMSYQTSESYDVVYMDGLLGHLYDPDHGIVPALTRARGFLRPGGCVIASNDAPPEGDSAPAPGVAGFSWLSSDFMRSEFVKAGFGPVQVHTFTYERPLSGPRTRAVVVAHFQGSV